MNQIIDDAYKNYRLKSNDIDLPENLYNNLIDDLNKDAMFPIDNPSRMLSKEKFISKCKTDSEFSEMWGLKIEERALSFEERQKLYVERCLASGDGLSGSAGPNGSIDYEFYEKLFVKYNVPTRLITITYNNETIESYELRSL